MSTVSGKRVIHYLSWCESAKQCTETPKTMVNYIIQLYKQNRAQKKPKQWIVGNNGNRWYALVQFSCKTAIRGIKNELQRRNQYNNVVAGHSLFNFFEFGMAHVVGQSTSYYWSYQKSDNIKKKIRFLPPTDDVIIRTRRIREPSNKHGSVLYGGPEDDCTPIYDFLCSEGFRDVKPTRTIPDVSSRINTDNLIIVENKPPTFNELYYNARQTLSDSARQFELLYALLSKKNPTVTKSTQTESPDCLHYAYSLNSRNNHK